MKLLPPPANPAWPGVDLASGPSVTVTDNYFKIDGQIYHERLVSGVREFLEPDDSIYLPQLRDWVRSTSEKAEQAASARPPATSHPLSTAK